MIAHAPIGTQELQEEQAIASASRPTSDASRLEDDELRALIAKRAYFLAEQRGFEPGHDVEDWLAAEAAVLDDFAEGVR